MRTAFLREERGYAMAALLVAMSVMAIMLSAVMPVYQTLARREREAELVFRGEQYARAIALFQRKYANALPPDVDVLIEQRFLRKEYKDPITGGDFQFLGPASPELAEALSTTPQQAQDALRGRGAGARGTASPFGRSQAAGPAAQQTGRSAQSGSGFTPIGRGTSSFIPAGRGAQTAAGQAANAQAAGGILAVASKSTETSLRLYNGKDKYNQWVFMALQASLTAGAPPGSGGQAPGGRGGRAGGRGGTSPAPGGTRGRGGFSPMGTGR